MIYGLGTDIVAIARVQRMLEAHGERLLDKLLSPAERATFVGRPDPARALAKRFAAKEAFAKALGTGLRAPATLQAIGIDHDALGKPFFCFDAGLTAWMQSRNLVAHLSLSDEKEFVVAVAIVERN